MYIICSLLKRIFHTLTIRLQSAVLTSNQNAVLFRSTLVAEFAQMLSLISVCQVRPVS